MIDRSYLLFKKLRSIDLPRYTKLFSAPLLGIGAGLFKTKKPSKLLHCTQFDVPTMQPNE